MHLDREQEDALRGRRGSIHQWAMERLVRLGDVTGAERMVRITSAHIPDHEGGQSSQILPSLIDEGDLTFPVITTVNPCSTRDPLAWRGWQDLEHRGLRHSFTCTPHLVGNHPARKGVIAWGGRAATAFANSILGAHSEMETFDTALASSIVGLTPERGLHLDENRQGTVVMIVEDANIDPGLVGWAISKTVPDERPIVCGRRWGLDQAKRLAFSINAEGRIPLFHLCRQEEPPSGLERVHIEQRQLEDALPSGTGSTPDLVVIGCPHLSEQEINQWAVRSSDLTTQRPELWFFTSPLCMEKSPRSGGALATVGRVIVGCCPLYMKDEMSGRDVGCTSPALVDCLRRRGVRAQYLSEKDMQGLLFGR